MKIFISHSTKDREIALKLSSFLESLSNDIEVFCSSDSGAIPVGKNFVQTITAELRECDTFLPLISENYFSSKFCMIELGFAYSQLQCYNDKTKQQYICPFCLPPLSVNALSGTPLGNIEAARIDDAEGYRAILEDIQGFQTGQNKRIREFIKDIRTHLLLRTDLFAKADIDIFCADNVVIRSKRDFASYSIMGGEVTFNFNLDPYERGGERPNFISLVYRFVDKVDFEQLLSLNENCCLAFEIESFTNSLSKIDLEFKFSDNNRILKTYHFPVRYGENRFAVSLVDMRSDALKHISEICFVIHPGDTVENEGMIKICNMRILTDI